MQPAITDRLSETTERAQATPARSLANPRLLAGLEQEAVAERRRHPRHRTAHKEQAHRVGGPAASYLEGLLENPHVEQREIDLAFTSNLVRMEPELTSKAGSLVA